MTLCNIYKIFLSPRASSCCPAVVCFVAQTARPAPTIVQDPSLPIWPRSCLWAKKDYEEMPAKKWRLSTDKDALVLRLNVLANFPEQRRAQAVSLIGCFAIRSQPDGSGLLQKRVTASSFTRASCYSWSSKGHTSTTDWQNIRSVPHFLQPPAIDKEHESKAKMYVNQMAWRDGANLKAHITSRAFLCEIPVRGRFSFKRHFQPLSVGGFFSNQWESISRCPKSPFPSQTQTWQIARTSPLIIERPAKV